MLTLLYLTVVSLLVVAFHGRVADWGWLVCSLGLFAVSVLVVAVWEGRCPTRPWVVLFHLVYPLLVVPLLYPMVQRYVLVLWGRFLDSEMISVEWVVFGAQPNLLFDRIASRPLNEIMMACYSAYYPLLVVPPLLLVVRRRWRELELFVCLLLAALYVCYLGFVVVPLRGPVVALAEVFAQPSLSGYVVVPAQQFVMAHADPAGACFPSSHVAAAWVVLLVLRRIHGWRVVAALVPVVVGLTVAVVYTRYHYVADALAGLVVAGLCYGVGGRLWARASARRRGMARVRLGQVWVGSRTGSSGPR
ncbi:PAP2 superfamily protein [Goodfellowiella coeruleoviolacea]|uniref:PAP2 superfamily protein n=1 Tax=Goodfellowiella coeruleoviolacea TaxID=334858 RepID=A0AAE3GHP5_9PSEU|nr:PAP2 superfamily protein [Goodfellowiella coeruleoviolacea]